MGEITEIDTTVGFRHGDTDQSQLAEFRPQIPGKLVVAVNGRRARCNLSCRKLRNSIAQHVQGFAKAEIKVDHDVRVPVGDGMISAKHPNGVGAVPAFACPAHHAIKIEQALAALIHFDHVTEGVGCIDKGKLGSG